MSIEYIRKKLYERNVKKHQEVLSPQEKYNEMHNNIIQISGTKGFAEIVEWFKREMDMHETRIEEIKMALLSGKKVEQNHINTVLTSHGLAKKFLTFLINLLDAQKKLDD